MTKEAGQLPIILSLLLEVKHFIQVVAVPEYKSRHLEILIIFRELKCLIITTNCLLVRSHIIE